MKFNKKILAIAICAVAVVAAITAVVIVKNQPKGMTIAVSTLPDSLNPVLEQNISGLNANELVFDGLCNFEVIADDSDNRTLVTEFALAEDIQQDSKSRKVYTITLKDVQWHDSTQDKPHYVCADDVVYSFKAYTLKENKSPKKDYLDSFIKDVRSVDEKTVEVEFKNPIPEFRAYPVLTFKIIPAVYNGKELNVNLREGENERNFATAPVGTGPFKLTGWEIGKWLTFAGNGLYEAIKQKPAADSLVIKNTIDPIVRMNELRKGRINVILETNPMDRAAVAKIPDVDINSYMPYAFYEVAINNKLFPNDQGRQAMAMAISKKDLVPGITDEDEGVVINNGPFPSNLFATTVSDYFKGEMPNNLKFNVPKAKKLASAGGISGQNAILIYPDSMGEFGKKLSEGVAKQLKEIGLNVEIKRTGDQVYRRQIAKQDYELALMYREGFDNVYSTIGSIYRSKGSENVTGVSDKKLNSLLDAWEKEVSTEKWIDLTLQLDKRITDICPSLPLCTLQKDVYSHGLENVLIATDNPFLSVEDWKFKN